MELINHDTAVGFQLSFILVGFLGLMSVFVVLTPLLFKRMRRLLFLRILVTISLCDLATAVTYILSVARPLDKLRNTYLCQVQGAMYTFSTNASISWTIALSYQLYTINKYSKPYLSELVMHLIFWGIPIFLQLLPLFVGMTYGMDDDGTGEVFISTCYIRMKPLNSSKLTVLGILIDFYTPMTVVVLVVLYFATIRAIDSKSQNPALYEVTKVMRLYPLAIGFCWIPLNIAGLFLMFSDNLNYEGYIVTELISSFYGILVTLIYFYGSEQARNNCYILLTKFTTNEADLNMNSSFIVSDGQEYQICDNDIVICEASVDSTILLANRKSSLTTALLDS